jgi:hypothetical protein
VVRLLVLAYLIAFGFWGCSAPSYVSVPPADPGGLDRRLAPSRPEQATVRDQHLGGLHGELLFLEESLLRAEQQRINACRDPDAVQVSTRAYERCQLTDHIYERLKNDVAQSRMQYRRAIIGSGGSGQ